MTLHQRRVGLLLTKQGKPIFAKLNLWVELFGRPRRAPVIFAVPHSLSGWGGAGLPLLTGAQVTDFSIILKNRGDALYTGEMDFLQFLLYHRFL